jgi:hypothetical protein
MVDAPAPDYGEQSSSLAAEQFTTTNTLCELKLRLVGPLGACGRDANGMPVRVLVYGENKIVRIEKKDDEFGATSLVTAVSGAGNTRGYRFTPTPSAAPSLTKWKVVPPGRTQGLRCAWVRT